MYALVVACYTRAMVPTPPELVRGGTLADPDGVVAVVRNITFETSFCNIGLVEKWWRRTMTMLVLLRCNDVSAT